MHNASNPRFWVIIPAAGSGRRMGNGDRPKQYLPLAGRTVIEWAVAPFLRQEAYERIVVALAADDPHWRENPLSSHSRVIRAPGGAERADSVEAGLAALSGYAHPDDWVLVHDAARPCLADSDLKLLMDQLTDDPVGGLLAAPVVDTLKRADEHGYVAQTVSRDRLWRALTPQMFRFGVLERALRFARERAAAVTDDSQAVELLGLRPRLIASSFDNLKVTTPYDLERAAEVLAARERW
jgi:2-C-methyl-D-erythritol 4-phosphate cytidylyltransferase